MEVILEAKGLYKTFPLGKTGQQNVLSNINLSIKKGEFVSIMGPSGSGKSTLLYNLSGMDRIISGSAKFYGTELSTMPEKKLSSLRLNKMGFVFQQIYLLKNLSIFDNIVLSGYLAKKRSRGEIDIRAIELMDKMGIRELANQNITQASGGQLQRVAICRALINQPDILFGDEPTGALNTTSAQNIMEILIDTNQQSATTILLATHDIKVAIKTERVIYIIDGKIVAELQLNKYIKNRSDDREREAQLTDMLISMGF